MENGEIYDSTRDREHYECKMDNLITLNWKVFVQRNPVQPRLGGKQKTGKGFLQLMSNKGLISKIYRELSQIYMNTNNFPIDKWLKDMNRQFSEEEIKGIYSFMKKML